MLPPTDNHGALELKRRAERRVQLMNDIAELQEELKQLKAEDKADGYNEKALGNVIKSLRKDASWHAAQLELELELETYRKAVGLPTDIEEAQKRVREEATAVPDVDPEDSGADPDSGAGWDRRQARGGKRGALQ